MESPIERWRFGRPMNRLDMRRSAKRVSDVNDAFFRSKIEKLEKRLRHQRAAGKTLGQNSILTVTNDQVIFDMETKLLKLKRAAEPHKSAPPLDTNPANQLA